MMRQVILVPLALLLGLVVGAWGPRSELRQVRDDVKRLEGLLKESRSAPKNNLETFSRLLNLPDGRARQGPAPARSNAVVAVSLSTNSPEAAAGGSNSLSVTFGAHGGASGARTAAQDRATLRERIDQAIELWKVRSDIARSTFMANVHMKPEDAAQFDVVVEAMNVRLKERMGYWADQMKSDQFQMGDEQGIRMMSDLGQVMVLTYDEMDRKMPQGWRGAAGDDFHLVDMVDPSVATPLIDVQDKLSRPPSASSDGGDSRGPFGGHGPFGGRGPMGGRRSF